MESTQDQAEMQSTPNDQPDVATSEQAQTENSQTFDINGQTFTWDQLVDSYKNAQAELTRKSQALSTTKKDSQLSDDDKKAIDFIRENGFVTKDDLNNLKQRQELDIWFKDILESNPDLKQFETAIKEIQGNTWIAYEDVIEKYGFKSKNKLSKAKSQGDIKGTPQKEKSITDMSVEEYTKWKQEKGYGENRWTFS